MVLRRLYGGGRTRMQDASLLQKIDLHLTERHSGGSETVLCSTGLNE